MIPISIEEVERQTLILDLYNAFDLDKFGGLVYSNMKKLGVEGGRLIYAPNERDVILTLFYEIDGVVEKEVVYLNVFDVFGKARHKKELKDCLRDYYVSRFGNEYIKVSAEYERHKKNRGIKEYMPGEELLLEPW